MYEISTRDTPLGKHGIGRINANGLLLLQHCTELKLTITGTIFQMKDRFKATWQHMPSKHWHQLDHIIANKAALQSIHVTCADVTANCYTDHRLLVTKCNFKLQKAQTRSSPLKHYNTSITTEKKQELEDYLNQNLTSTSDAWDETKVTLQHAAKEVCVFKRSTNPD